VGRCAVAVDHPKEGTRRIKYANRKFEHGDREFEQGAIHLVTVYDKVTAKEGQSRAIRPVCSGVDRNVALATGCRIPIVTFG
jgi:hypothetical protein